MNLENLRGKVLLSLCFGVLVVFALMFYGDFTKILQTIVHFRWEYLPLILGLTLLNYFLRFIKWDYYLHQIGVDTLSKRDSLLVFFSGLSMVITPGKLGEWVKSYLLKEISGTAFSRSAPIIIAERLSDGIALLLLASAGFFLFRVGWEVAAAVVVLAAAIVFAAQSRPLALRLIGLMERLPLVSSQAHLLHAFYESSNILLSTRNLLFAVTLGFFSWLGECVAFYFVLSGLGVEPSALLLVQAAFILSVSSLGASIVLLPGGLGMAEGGITGLSQFLVGAPKDVAVAAALIIRFCTLWFGVALGMIMLFIVTRRLAKK
ncbi:MAG: flippase-like domain-containing protein [Chloroflexi bacterium]|nr:flippase-like domain-containing protein [Chloroflexota bacterium]